MIYEHPLGYLLGLEGLVLLRGYLGEFDRDFVEARIAEVRRLLDDESLAGAGVDVERVDTVAGYRLWSETYDQPGNPAFDLDTPFVTEIVGHLPAGDALDAACGTGRIAGLLAAHGHRVIGVDGSPDMLARARERVPDGDFRIGELARLPVPDDSVDLVTCALALTHNADLDPVLAEFARVLRPGGHVVISDLHPDMVLRGYNPSLRGPDGTPQRIVSHVHSLGDYLRAALSVGLQVRRCEEPCTSRVDRPLPPTAPTAGPWEEWPWSLALLAPEAARAANTGAREGLVWHFQLTGP